MLGCELAERLESAGVIGPCSFDTPFDGLRARSGLTQARAATGAPRFRTSRNDGISFYVILASEARPESGFRSQWYAVRFRSAEILASEARPGPRMTAFHPVILANEALSGSKGRSETRIGFLRLQHGRRIPDKPE